MEDIPVEHEVVSLDAIPVIVQSSLEHGYEPSFCKILLPHAVGCLTSINIFFIERVY